MRARLRAMMTITLPTFPLFVPATRPADTLPISLQSHVVQTLPKLIVSTRRRRRTQHLQQLETSPFLITSSSSSRRLVRNPRLDQHVVKQNKIRFVQNLKTLLLSKPNHFVPVRLLNKWRSFLSLPKPQSLRSMIRRYPTVFEIFSMPTPQTPFNATVPLSQLCVRLTPAATALAKSESDFKRRVSNSLACKLQKLLMLASPHHRILLSKLVHLGPDLGLPSNFHSRLCNGYPDRFRTVHTSYGRALELVAWDPSLAEVLPLCNGDGLIVDRPLKFERVRLQKGLNVKRRHHQFLVRFGQAPSVCPYGTTAADLGKESVEAEKRACAVVREVLGMTVEKRTLVDHLTHFRNEFGLPKRLRAMLVRHPDMFYVSLKGQRDSIFLVEGFSDKGTLLEKDEIVEIRNEMLRLVREGKTMRREEGKEFGETIDDAPNMGSEANDKYFDEWEDDDGLDDLFETEEGYDSLENDLDGDDGNEDGYTWEPW